MANPAIISTYTLLKNALEDHLNRSDIDDEGVSAMAIDLAEARLNREVIHPKRYKSNNTFTVDAQYKDAPTDLWAVKRFGLNTSPVQHMEYLTPEEMFERRQSLSASGRPVYYTVAAGTDGTQQFEFLPTPGSSYTGLLLYTAAIPNLAANATNWLLDDHPDLYLQASILEAHIWAQDWEQADRWEARYQRTLASINRAGSREAHGSTPIARAKPLGRNRTYR